MNTVSAEFLAVLRATTRDLVFLAELYDNEALPGEGGFDPADALDCFASVSGVVFRSRAYRAKIERFSDITHTDPSTGGSFGNATLTFGNVDRFIGAFHANNDLEGMYMVLRAISRSVSSDLDDSLIVYVGRNDKPGDADKKQLPLGSMELLASVDLEIPPRSFTQDDDEDRRASDPLFEGFRFLPRLFTVNYVTQEPKGGIFGNLLGLEKDVTKSLPASSHSALDVNRAVPMGFGFVQVRSNHIGYADFGNSVAMMTAWFDAKPYGIHAYVNIRNVDPSFGPIDDFPEANWPSAGGVAYVTYGEQGGTGGQQTAPIEGTQAPNVGLGYHSYTAWTYTFVNGSEVSQDDAAPMLIAVMFANKVLTPGNDGVYDQVLFSDHGADHVRFIWTQPHLMNIDPAFVDDPVMLDTRNYCAQILVDETNSDTLVLPEAEAGKAGVDYQHWRSSGTVSADYYKWQAGDTSGNPFGREAAYIHQPVPPIENGSGGGPPDPTNPDPPTLYRRRYTSNFVLTETQKASDALKNLIYPASRFFHTYGANGKLQLRVKKPADNSLLRDDVAEGATEIPVYSVLAWKNSLEGKALIGAHLVTSEVRVITGYRYTTVSNSITLSASGGVSASSATLTGGNNATTTATATLTVTDETGDKTITIDGIDIVLTPAGDDTTATVAGLIKDAINSHSRLGPYIKASWTPGASTVLIESKLGFLQFAAPLEFDHAGPIASPIDSPVLSAGTGGHLAAGEWWVAFSYQTANGETRISPAEVVTVAANGKITTDDQTLPDRATAVNWFLSREESSLVLKYATTTDGTHAVLTEPPKQRARLVPGRNSTGEECTRVMMSFSDRVLVQADCTRANILMDSFKAPLGTRQKPVNGIDLPWIDKIDDFRLNEIRITDRTHKAKVKRRLPEKINGRAIDNFNQAWRVANQFLAEKRDGDEFASFESDGEAMLLQIGDVVCVTDYGSGLMNFPIALEEWRLGFNGAFKVGVVGRKYSSTMRSDEVVERAVPYPTTLTLPRLISEARVEVEVEDGEYLLNNRQANARTIEFTGALTGDVTVKFPDGSSRRWVLKNSTTGAHTLEIDTVTGGSPFEVPQGETADINGHGGVFEQILT